MIGERIGNFRIVSRLGQGGMGEVYLGEHEKIGTKVAIKMLLPHISANKEHVERFFNEAIAVGKIQHAGICKIFDVGFHDAGRAYLAMEFLGGESLAARIRRLGRLPLPMTAELGRQISGVLEAVHKAGITHRDLKPDNIFIVPDDELESGERVKVLDFGIAKLSGIGGGMTATSAGSMGTPAYMSPEQWKNSKNVDWRADAYSLGCLAFEMAAGRPPFLAETIGEACSKHLTEDPPPLGSVVAAPAALDSLIARLLQKSPDARPSSMREVSGAFGALASTRGGLATTQLSSPQIVPPPSHAVRGIPTVPSGLVGRIEHPTPLPIKPVTTLGSAVGAADIVAAPNRRALWAVLGIGSAIAVVVIVLAFVIAGRSDGDTVAAKQIDAAAENKPGPPPPSVQPISPNAVDPPANSLPAVAIAPPAPNPPPAAQPPPARPPSVDSVALGKYGFLSLNATPAGKVLIDGKPMGETPLAKLPLSPGNHVVIVMTPQGKQTVPITIVAGKDLVKLIKVDTAKVADHSVESGSAEATCDEVSCVVSNYEAACCAKFKPSKPPPKIDPATDTTSQGVLMLGSKPICEIFIDGVSTGLKTPQRELKLRTGRHRITLINNELGINEKFTVEIKADQVEKMIKDYSDRMPK